MKLSAIFMAVLTIASTATVVHADDGQDSYCKYVLEQGSAQRDLLRTPSATSGVVQPNTGLPAQLLWGVSSSLASLKKAGLSMEVARKNCELYRSTTEAQLEIQYALPSLEKAALNNRLQLIKSATDQLDTLITNTVKFVQAQNATVPMLYTLHSARMKFFKDKADTELKVALMPIPEVSSKPVIQLVSEKQNDEVKNQKAIDRLARLNNWDVTIEAGARHQLNPFFTNGVGPYITASLTYNLANKAINTHLDKAADGYANWKLNEEGDVVKNADILKKQITSSLAVEEEQLKILESEDQEIESNLKLVADVETIAALNFRNQLLTDELSLRVEIGDATFRLQQLREYLQTNF